MLIADDERWIRERLAHSIDWASVRVKVSGEAGDGEEALARATELKPDIILTDIRMPVISGLEFLAALKEKGAGAKVIIISGYDDFKYAQKAIKLGVYDYILKPVENDDLLEIVKKCADRIAAEAQKEALAAEGEMSRALRQVKETPDEQDAGKQRKIIAKALNYIEKNYTKPITLTDIAEYTALNASYFSKLFKDTTGVPFNKFLTRFRIEKAAELLKDPTLKIYEVADKVGYENVQYFNKVFKYVEGITPNEFKEKI
jgi:two-component system response regulator YesN